MTERIVIVGGGFAGFWAALAARRVARSMASVTVVSREPVLQMRPRLYEAHPETLGVDLLPLFASTGVEFLEGEAAGLDIDRRAVHLANGQALPFDRLIIATGSVMRRPPVPGADSAWSIDTQADAIAFDRRLAELATGSAQPSVAVIGAGFTGIELALELRDRIATHGGLAVADRLRIALFDRAPVVGAELGPGPRAEIEQALSAARVSRHLGASITSLSATRITLADGATLSFDAVVLTTGMVAAPFVAHVPGERDTLGRLIVAHDLRAPEAPAIFVTGDAAAADTGDGHLSLQSCQHALQLGRFAGENAARDLLGLPTIPYSHRRYVTCLDLGRSGAVFTEGWDRTVTETGPTAKARKRRINTDVIYPPVGANAETLLGLSSLRE